MRYGVLTAAVLLAATTVQAAEPALPQTARVTTSHSGGFQRAEKAEKAASASDVIKGFYGKLQSVMQNGTKLGFQGRYDALKPAVERAFDLPVMTRFASGSGWYKAAPEQQAKLVRAFGEFSVATYASRFKAFNDEKFIVMGEKPATGGGVLVETQLVPFGDPPVSLNYLMRRDASGQWRINDVYLAATISEMATRRSEFNAVIKSDGFDALIDNISLKTKSLHSS
ncbi:MAG: ABC transporter substrate-binding protein [Alphaproteobacteria bacterium]